MLWSELIQCSDSDFTSEDSCILWARTICLKSLLYSNGWSRLYDKDKLYFPDSIFVSARHYASII